jgi:hypothetical protein
VLAVLALLSVLAVPPVLSVPPVLPRRLGVSRSW